MAAPAFSFSDPKTNLTNGPYPKPFYNNECLSLGRECGTQTERKLLELPYPWPSGRKGPGSVRAVYNPQNPLQQHKRMAVIYHDRRMAFRGGLCGDCADKPIVSSDVRREADRYAARESGNPNRTVLVCYSQGCNKRIYRPFRKAEKRGRRGPPARPTPAHVRG